jgi:hypothetical protein
VGWTPDGEQGDVVAARPDAALHAQQDGVHDRGGLGGCGAHQRLQPLVLQVSDVDAQDLRRR